MTAECAVCGQIKDGPVPVARPSQLPGEILVKAGQPPFPFACFECLKKADQRRLQEGRLLFFPDYGADPLWEAHGWGGMVSLDGLPVREGTRRDVREWARRWEQMATQEMAADASAAGMVETRAEPVSPQEWDDLERDGRAVWLRLRDDLGDEWVVGWVGFAETGRQVEWSPGAAPEPLPAPIR
jgi:hypothetical protein